MAGCNVPKGTKSRGFLVRYVHFQPDFNKIQQCAKRYKKVAKREKLRCCDRHAHLSVDATKEALESLGRKN